MLSHEKHWTILPSALILALLSTFPFPLQIENIPQVKSDMINSGMDVIMYEPKCLKWLFHTAQFKFGCSHKLYCVMLP